MARLNRLLYGSVGVGVAGVLLFARYAMWGGVTLKVDVSTAPGVLGLMMLVALFIERAVEVVISPWRDGGAARLERAAKTAVLTAAGQAAAQAVAAAAANAANAQNAGNVAAAAAQNPAEAVAALNQANVVNAANTAGAAGAVTGAPAMLSAGLGVLDEYKGVTKVYAYATAFAFGLVAAMCGVRALWPFVVTDAASAQAFWRADAGQRNTFIVFDVILSAALLAGGANGIHSIVTAFTGFFDNAEAISDRKAESGS